jgi:cytochrome c oxidase cbb3-type subunit III
VTTLTQVFAVLTLMAALSIMTECTLAGPQAERQELHGHNETPADLGKGKQLFEDNCAVCHGVDAAGGDGPDIRKVPDTLGDDAVQNIIRRGVPGTSMPSFFDIDDAGARDIVAYLHRLNSEGPTETVKGDPLKGKEVYETSGCAACHMIAGEGGSIGPELTRIGAMRGAKNLHERLVNPAANLPKEGNVGDRGKWTLYLMFRAFTKDGQTIEGIRVGEDSFTIVLKDASGTFHALWKPGLRSLEKEPEKSLMPSFKGTLSDSQLDDLVSYLAGLKGAQ